MQKSILNSKTKVKEFFVTDCNGDQAKFLGEFEGLAIEDLKKVCKTFKIQQGKNGLATAKKLLKEVTIEESEKEVKANTGSNKNHGKKPSSNLEAASNSTGHNPSKGMELKLDPEVEKKVPKMSKLEMDLLKESIKKEGYNPDKFITILEDGTIIDGHSRYRACQELKVEIPPECFKIIPEDAVDRIIKENNLFRRQIKVLSKVMLIQNELKEIEKKYGRGTRQAREAKAKAAQVSQGTIQQIEFLENYAPDRYKNSVQEKKETVKAAWTDETKKYREVKDQDPDLFKKVKEKEVTLQEAFEKVKEAKKEQKQKKISKQQEIVEEIKEFALRQIKKYNNRKVQYGDSPDGKALKEIMDKIDNVLERLTK